MPLVNCFLIEMLTYGHVTTLRLRQISGTSSNPDLVGQLLFEVLRSLLFLHVPMEIKPMHPNTIHYLYYKTLFTKYLSFFALHDNVRRLDVHPAVTGLTYTTRLPANILQKYCQDHPLQGSGFSINSRKKERNKKQETCSCVKWTNCKYFTGCLVLRTDVILYFYSSHWCTTDR